MNHLSTFPNILKKKKNIQVIYTPLNIQYPDKGGEEKRINEPSIL